MRDLFARANFANELNQLIQKYHLKDLTPSEVALANTPSRILFELLNAYNTLLLANQEDAKKDDECLSASNPKDARLLAELCYVSSLEFSKDYGLEVYERFCKTLELNKNKFQDVVVDHYAITLCISYITMQMLCPCLNEEYNKINKRPL